MSSLQMTGVLEQDHLLKAWQWRRATEAQQGSTWHRERQSEHRRDDFPTLQLQFPFWPTPTTESNVLFKGDHHLGNVIWGQSGVFHCYCS